jgi:hypothetical protein
MRWTVSLLALAFICGCSQQPIESQTRVSPPQEKGFSVPNASIEIPGSNATTIVEYPEKTEVERLLSRAVQLEATGNFQEALVIVDTALALDAHSPRASSYKQRLEKIIRRI